MISNLLCGNIEIHILSLPSTESWKIYNFSTLFCLPTHAFSFLLFSCVSHTHIHIESNSNVTQLYWLCIAVCDIVCTLYLLHASMLGPCGAPFSNILQHIITRAENRFLGSTCDVQKLAKEKLTAIKTVKNGTSFFLSSFSVSLVAVATVFYWETFFIYPSEVILLNLVSPFFALRLSSWTASKWQR